MPPRSFTPGLLSARRTKQLPITSSAKRMKSSTPSPTSTGSEYPNEFSIMGDGKGKLEALKGSNTHNRLPRKILLKPLDTSLRVTRVASPSPELPLLTRFSPSPRASYRPVLVRTYKYERHDGSLTPTRSVPTHKPFKCYWSKLPYQEGRPEVREGASLAECCDSLFLYGGLSKTVLSDMYVLRPGSRAWETVSLTGLEPECRYGHSMERQGAVLVVFGGAINANPKTQLRECFNTVRLLKPTGENGAHWSLLRTHGRIVEMRRYHSASIVGKHMLVLGGLNQKNKVLDDCALLDLSTGEWTLETLYPGPLAIACHSAVVVCDQEVTGLSDLCLPSAELKQVGIYLFGGMDGLGCCSNALRVVQPTTEGKLTYMDVQATGTPPAPRCLQSMVLCRANNVLVVFGGKSQETRLNAAAVYRDLHVLELTSLHWNPVTVSGHLPQARWAHSAGTLQDKIVLFGGIEFNMFSSSETFLLSISSDPLLPAVRRAESRSKSTEKIRVKQKTFLM